MKGKRRNPVVLLLRAAVGVGVLAYLFSQLRGGEVAAALRSVNVPIWVAAMLLYLAGQALCAWKWGILASALGMKHPYRSLLAFYCGGMFANLFLPTTVGGDAFRAGAVSVPDGSFARGLISALGDRASGLVALMLLAGGSALLLPGIPPGLRLAAVAGAVLMPAGAAVALAVPGPFRRLGETVHGALLACREPSVLVPVALTALLFQVMIAVVHSLLGQALGLSIPVAYYFLASTLVAVVSMAPISINGIGTRDAAYVYFLGLAHVPREAGLAFALSYLALLLVSAGIGGLLFSLLAPSGMSLLKRREPEPAGEGET